MVNADNKQMEKAMTVKEETVSEKKSNGATKNIVAGIDIDKLVKKAQDSYGKKDAGAAKRLATGRTIHRPNDDKDFVVWTKGDFWQTLTHLKGLPFGRIVEISGKPDSGKSSCAMCFMKFAQEQNVLVILWDAERKFSATRFDEKIGGKSDQLLIVDTNKIVDGAKAVAQFVHAAKEMDPEVKILIVWDSVGASLNSTEDKEEDEDFSQQPGVSAKENSYAVKKFVKLMNRYANKETGAENIAVLAINQTYSSIGMGAPTQIEKGGQALYYFSSLIIQLSRKGDLTRIKKGEKYKYGIITKAKAKKNHLFDGDECIAQLELVVSAEGIHLAKDVKNFDDIKGWDDAEEDDSE
jgi:RecA/RadA recombinase